MKVTDEMRSAVMADLGRRGAKGRNMREVGALGCIASGKTGKPTRCPRCGEPCPSRRQAGLHCRVKRTNRGRNAE